MLRNVPAPKFGAHLYPCRAITWLESSVPVLISKDQTRTEYDFGSSFGTRIRIGTKTNPLDQVLELESESGPKPTQFLQLELALKSG
jgi:hypothetical protein